MKRNLFVELKEGMADMAAARTGKATLRKEDVERRGVVTVVRTEARTDAPLGHGHLLPKLGRVTV